MRVLIAEDDMTSRILLAGVLRKTGYEVEEASDGQEAFAKMQAPDGPQIAILDWMMPKLEGLEVVRKIRAQQSDHPPYLIMLTSRDGKIDVVQGLEAGANDYLPKPFDPGELRARVEVGCRMMELQMALFESREAMAHQATHDPLTGLLNRRAIQDILEKEMSRAGRHGNVVAVGVCDIDHFKQFNDKYGHQTGDDTLSEFARILREGMRDYDAVGRIGGEEFLIVAPMKEDMDCEPLFDRLLVRINKSVIKTRSGELSITASIGVACQKCGGNVNDIMSVADAALYEAKFRGRNRVIYGCKMHEKKGVVCKS